MLSKLALRSIPLLCVRNVTSFRSFRATSSTSFPRKACARCKLGVNATTTIHFRGFASVSAPQEVKVPTMGESITEGVLVKFHVAEGQTVAADQIIATIDTDKVSVDVRAPSAGTMSALLVKPGDNVKVGQSVAKITAGGAPAATPAAAAAAAPPPPPPAAEAAPKAAAPAAAASSSKSSPNAGAQEVKVPTMGESITEGVLVKFHVAEGQTVAADQIIATIDTDKVSVDVRAPSAGTMSALLVKAGDNVKVGQSVAKIAAGGAPSHQPAQQKAEPAPAPPPAQKKAAAPRPPPPLPPPPAPTDPQPTQPLPESAAAPAASRFSAETRDQPFGTPAYFAAPAASSVRIDRRVPVTPIKKRGAQRLKQSQNTAASLTTFNEVDMQKLIDIRARYKKSFEKKYGVKLGFMSFFIKAAATALMREPTVNATMEPDLSHIVYHDYVDISVAVATPKGLVVPVLRGCESKSIPQLEQEMASFATRARKNELSLDEITGGTFTISNGGVYGSLMGTPIINSPQSAILGMHAVKERPVAIKNKVVIRPMMYVALTYDHRVVNGQEAVTYLKTVKEIIEDPSRILLDL